MSETLISLLLVAWSSSALAQNHFAFAGLSWDASIEQVDLALQREGFSEFKSLEKLACKLKARCSLSFTGSPVKAATAIFVDGKLNEVHVVPHDYGATMRALLAKYGKPLPPPDNSAFALLKSQWEAPSGETLEAGPDYVIYRKGTKRIPQDTSKF